MAMNVAERIENRKWLKLQAKTGEIYEIPIAKTKCVKFFTGMLEDIESQDGMIIPIKEVEGPILKKVVDYCHYFYKHETQDISFEEANEWETNFVNVEKNMLFAMIRAANYLDIAPMLDLTCKTVADMVRNKSADEVNKEFAIPPGTHLY